MGLRRCPRLLWDAHGQIGQVCPVEASALEGRLHKLGVLVPKDCIALGMQVQAVSGKCKSAVSLPSSEAIRNFEAVTNDLRKERPKLLALAACCGVDALPHVDGADAPLLPFLLGLPFLANLQGRIDVFLGVVQGAVGPALSIQHLWVEWRWRDEHNVEPLGMSYSVRRRVGCELVKDRVQVSRVIRHGHILVRPGVFERGVVGACMGSNVVSYWSPAGPRSITNRTRW